MFNICMTILALPLLNYLVRFVRWVIPDAKKENPEQTLQFFANLPNFSAVLVIKQAQLVLAHMQAIGLDGYRQELTAADQAFIPAFDGTGVGASDAGEARADRA